MEAAHLEDAERRTREILAEAGLREPDEVEYGDTSIFLVWHKEKVVIQVADIPLTPPVRAEESRRSDGDAASRDA